MKIPARTICNQCTCEIKGEPYLTALGRGADKDEAHLCSADCVRAWLLSDKHRGNPRAAESPRASEKSRGSLAVEQPIPAPAHLGRRPPSLPAITPRGPDKLVPHTKGKHRIEPDGRILYNSEAAAEILGTKTSSAVTRAVAVGLLTCVRAEGVKGVWYSSRMLQQYIKRRAARRTLASTKAMAARKAKGTYKPPSVYKAMKRVGVPVDPASAPAGASGPASTPPQETGKPQEQALPFAVDRSSEELCKECLHRNTDFRLDPCNSCTKDTVGARSGFALDVRVNR